MRAGLRVSRLQLLLVLATAVAVAPVLADEAGEAVRAGFEALNEQRFPEAVERLETAVRLDPSNPQSWIGLAQARRLSGDADGAEAAIARLLTDFPPSPVLAHGVATYYLQSGNPVRAAEVARSGLERGPHVELFDVLGKALTENGEVEQAERAFRSAIELRPYDEDLRYNLGYLFLRTANYDEAVAAFEEARAVFDKSPRIELGVGVARYAQRRFGDAIDAFLRVSRLAPGFEQPHYFLGAALEHAADRLPAVQQRFRAFAAARPKHYLGPFLEAKGLLAAAGPRASSETLRQASALLETSLERRPEFWEAHFELGLIRERSKEYARARARFERAIELSPESTKPRYRLARVLNRLGEHEAAKEQQALHDELVAKQRSELLGGMDSPPTALAAP